MINESKDESLNGDIVTHNPEPAVSLVPSPQKPNEDQAVPVDHNLIEFDTR